MVSGGMDAPVGYNNISWRQNDPTTFQWVATPQPPGLTPMHNGSACCIVPNKGTICDNRFNNEQELIFQLERPAEQMWKSYSRKRIFNAPHLSNYYRIAYVTQFRICWRLDHIGREGWPMTDRYCQRCRDWRCSLRVSVRRHCSAVGRRRRRPFALCRRVGWRRLPGATAATRPCLASSPPAVHNARRTSLPLQ